MSDASVPRCHGLSEQAPPPVCSLLVVEDVLDVIRTRYLDAHTCSWTTLYSFFFFWAGSSKKVLDDCLLLLAAAVFFSTTSKYVVIFRVSSSVKVHGGCIIARKRGSLLHQTEVMFVLLFINDVFTHT